jgi:hypothetical protein
MCYKKIKYSAFLLHGLRFEKEFGSCVVTKNKKFCFLIQEYRFEKGLCHV